MADTQSILIKVSNLREIPIKPEMVLGRQAECDFQLTEGHASRRHARLAIIEGIAWLEDLGSANGTFVNGAKISGKVRLKSGDRLRFDVEEFDLRMPPASSPTDDKTVYRQPLSDTVEAESSGGFKRPGAWADPDAMNGGTKGTKFIDSAQLKQMMNDTPQTAVDTASVEGPHLHVVSGARTGLNIKLTVGESGNKEWTIGSSSERAVQFPDSGVSALHAKILNEGARWKVLDQMSANGTFVNGKRSNVSYLSAGDRVRFGPVECVFQISPSGAASKRSGMEPSVEYKSRTPLIAGIAFVTTIVVLYLVYQFLM